MGLIILLLSSTLKLWKNLLHSVILQKYMVYGINYRRVKLKKKNYKRADSYWCCVKFEFSISVESVD